MLYAIFQWNQLSVFCLASILHAQSHSLEDKARENRTWERRTNLYSRWQCGSDAWAEAVIQTCGFIQICIKFRINWGFSAPYTVSHNRVSMNDEWIIFKKWQNINIFKFRMKTPGVISLMQPLNELVLTSDFIQGTALGVHTNHCPWQQQVYFILITPCFRNCGYLGTVAPWLTFFPRDNFQFIYFSMG